MVDVNDWWEDTVDIRETGDADFESRREPITIYDRDGVYRTLVERLGAEYDLNRSTMTDFTIRVFLAHVLDMKDVLDVRNEFDQTVLVPPRGWVGEQNELFPVVDSDVDPDPIKEPTDRHYVFSTTPTVRAMVETLIEEYDFYEGKSDFTQKAIKFMARGATSD